MRIATRHTDEAARTQHLDTLDALKKAEDANALARTNAEKQLRAYVYFERTEIAPNIDGDRNVVSYSFSGVWKNVGQTPAIDAKISVYGMIANRGQPIYPIPPRVFAGAESNIGAGIDVKIGPWIVSVQELGSIAQGYKRFFLYTIVTYKTIFSDEEIPEGVCIELLVTSDPTKGGNVGSFHSATECQMRKD